MGQYDRLYSAAATPFSSMAPSATWPLPSWLDSGAELARVIRPCSFASAAATGPPWPSGQSAEARHHDANAPNATWNPAAWTVFGLQRWRIRVHRTVQDQRSHPAREQLRVPSTQVRSV